jgi:hypothetical protein
MQTLCIHRGFAYNTQSPLPSRDESEGPRCLAIAQGQAFRFTNDPEQECVLPMHYPLTYRMLAPYGSDPNAESLCALKCLAGAERCPVESWFARVFELLPLTSASRL